MEAMGDAAIIHENNNHKKSRYSNKTASHWKPETTSPSRCRLPTF